MEIEKKLFVGFEEPLDLSNVLIVNVNKLKADSYIDNNVSENVLRVAVLAVQDMVVEKITGTRLFNKLRELVCQQALDCPENRPYAELLNTYLFPVFSYGVQAEISIPLSFKNRNNGTTRPNPESMSQTQLNDIKYLNQYYQNKMDFYVGRAIRFLRCSCCFPELTDCSCEWANERPLSKKPSVSINLSMKNVKKPI